MGFWVVLMVLIVQCRESGGADKGMKIHSQAKSSGRKLDSSIATIRFEPIEDGYRFFLEPKDKRTKLESRCLSWTIEGLAGAKSITNIESNEDVCNNQSHDLSKREAYIRRVGSDSEKVSKSYGEEYFQILSAAKNPKIWLENIELQDLPHRFLEMPLGETSALITFISNDSCENLSEVNEGCGKYPISPPTVGRVQLKIRLIIQEGKLEVR